MLLAVSCNLAQTHNCHAGILISGVGTGQAAVAFFQTKDIIIGTGLLEEFDLFPDIFETGQHFNQLNIIKSADGCGHISGNDSSHQCRVLRHGTGGCSFPQNIFRDQHAGHISGKGYIFSCFSILAIYAQAVCIRVCGQNNIGILFFRQTKSIGKCLRVLGIRIIQGCKIRIRILLFRYHVDVLEAKLGQHSPYGQITGAAQRRVYDFYIFCHFFDDIGMNDLLLQLRHISIVDFSADSPIQAGKHSFFLVHGLHTMVIFDGLNLPDNLLVPGSRNLCTILPVHFITVIFRRIVACSDHDTCRTSQHSQSKGQLRCRSQGIKYISPDSIGSQTQACLICKLRRHSPGIICDSYSFLLSTLF